MKKRSIFLGLGGLQRQRPRKGVPGALQDGGMASSRVADLISFFKTLDNRKGHRLSKGEVPLENQTEEAYRKEQAAWLAQVAAKRKKK